MKAKQEEVKKKGGAGAGKVRLRMLEQPQLLNDTCNTSKVGTHRVQVKTPAGHKTLCPGGPVIACSTAKAKGAVPLHNYSCTNARTHTRTLSMQQC